MKRRTFLRTSMAAGFVGAGGVGTVPTLLATPRSRWTADDPIRLSSNENPLGISPAARRAIVEGLDRANRYPGASEEKLLPVLAERLGVPREQIILGTPFIWQVKPEKGR